MKKKKFLIRFSFILILLLILFLFLEKVILIRLWKRVENSLERRYSLEIQIEKVQFGFPLSIKLKEGRIKQKNGSGDCSFDTLFLFAGKNETSLISEILEYPELIWLDRVIVKKVSSNIFPDFSMDLLDFRNRELIQVGYKSKALNGNIALFLIMEKSHIKGNFSLKTINYEDLEYLSFFNVEKLDMNLQSDFVINQDSGYIQMDGKLSFNELGVLVPSISNQSLNENLLDLEFTLESQIVNFQFPRYLKLSEGKLMYNGIQGEMELLYSELEGDHVLTLSGRLPESPIQNIFEAIPDGVKGDLAGSEFEGSFSWSGSVQIPLDRPYDFQYDSFPIVNDIKVLALPEQVNIYSLRDQFIYSIPYPSGSKTIVIPPPLSPSMEWSLAISEQTERQVNYWQNWVINKRSDDPIIINRSVRQEETKEDFRYVRLDEMSLWIPKAVLTGEDGDFFHHNGINWLTFENVVRKNIESGELGPGASTISMQTIKNIYLSQSRVLSRKIQEMFLVYLTEMVVPVSKERIFEVYLNIIEYGPGIYGIAHACRYYFDKNPSEITAGEAVWLISILPAPFRFHSFYEEGEISDEWFAHMGYYFDIMLKRGRMTREEYRDAIKKPPAFVKAADNILTDS